MNWERIRISIETTVIRGRGLLRLVGQVAGIVLVLLGGYNMLGAPITGDVILPLYRTLLPNAILFDASKGAVYLADVLVAAIGAVLAWFL